MRYTTARRKSAGEVGQFSLPWRWCWPARRGLKISHCLVSVVVFTLVHMTPGDPAVTTAAVEDFAQELREGEPVMEALQDLARRIKGYGD